MKYLLLLLIFTINTSFAISCNNKSIENVNSCTVNDRLIQLIHEVRPEFRLTSKELYIEDSENKYYFEGEEQVYEFLVIDPILPLSELQTPLDTWKDQETNRLDYWNRLDDIEHLRLAMVACDLNQPNAAIFVRDLKRDLDEAKLTCLESHKVALKSAHNAEKAKDKERKDARKLSKNWDCTTERFANDPFLKAVCEAR